ncbi:MAG: nucleotidyltransferase family protein [Nitrospirae bacterium]|nr:nucleotidyltransferase family protein [Nitrospirota bacterium]
MGQSKQLLPLKDKPMIRHCLDALISSGIKDIVVVLGSGDMRTVMAVKGLPVYIVFNNVPESDMAGSVRTGLKSVLNSSTGVLISLADQPLVSVETIKTLVAHHEEGPDKILIPQYETKKGHPVLLPKNLLEDIFPDGTLRDIIRKHSDRVILVPVTDEGVIIDVDTTEDYNRILKIVTNEPGLP